MSHVREFDAVLTVGAMENIPPEGCPLLLANPHRARRPGRVMYLTVEEVEHRGLATLPVRVRAQQDSAGKLATWLTAHPAVRQVYYRPGPGATRIRLTGPAGHHATENGQNDRTARSATVKRDT